MSEFHFPIPLEMIVEYVSLRDSSIAQPSVEKGVKWFTAVFKEFMGREASANDLLQACIEKDGFSATGIEPADMARVVELSLDYFEISGLYE